LCFRFGIRGSDRAAEQVASENPFPESRPVARAQAIEALAFSEDMVI
jgi:hypothetical protein